MNQNSHLVDRYFACMRERNVEELTRLFAADAMMILPDGREFAGVPAIHAMYTSLFATQSPSPTVIARILGADGAATEIEARLPDGTVRRTGNFFHLNTEGLIQRLNIYGRGG